MSDKRDKFFKLLGHHIILFPVLVQQTVRLPHTTAVVGHLRLQLGRIFNDCGIAQRQRVHALLKLAAKRPKISLARFHVRPYLRQMLVLNNQSGIEHGQPLRILNQIAQFAVLLPQLLHLQVAFEYLALRSVPLLCEVCLE